MPGFKAQSFLKILLQDKRSYLYGETRESNESRTSEKPWLVKQWESCVTSTFQICLTVRLTVGSAGLVTCKPKRRASHLRSILALRKFLWTGVSELSIPATRTGYSPTRKARPTAEPACGRACVYRQTHRGWHTFRHSSATWLKANGEDVKIVQESFASHKQQN
jgi:hypothetical protein